MKKYTLMMMLSLLFYAELSAQYSLDWFKTGGNAAKIGNMIARDSLDNVFVTGYIQAENIYTRKYNKFGTLQWEKISTSGIASNYEKPVWVSIDKNNNAIVVGYRYSISSKRDYPNAIVVLKYNPSGALLWKKSMAVSVLVGKNTSVFNLRSEVDNNGNIYIGTVTANPSGFNLYKLNSSGIVVFIKNSTVNAPVGFNSLRLKGNKIIITGSSSNRSLAPVIAWDTTGAVLWTSGVQGQSGNDVEIDNAGNTYLLTSYANQVSGSSGQDILIYKFNATGSQLWKKSFDFGGSDFSTRFALAGNKLSVIGYGSINASYFDWITFQVNDAGTRLWNTRYNATTGNDELPAFIVAKENGEVFITGKGGPLITQVNGSSYLRMITLKYNNNGTVQWVDSINNNGGFGIASSLAKDSSLYVLSHANMTAYHFLDQTTPLTPGICAIPTGIFATNTTTSSSSIIWSPVANATLYHLRYKTASASTWTVLSTNATSYFLTGLSGGTSYDFAVEAVCSNGPSGYSTTKTFNTFGNSYCITGGQSQARVYLSFVYIGEIMSSTGGNGGYADYTNLNLTLSPGQVVSGYLSGLVPYPEYLNYCIWIDYNHDNDFSDPGEQAVNLLSGFTGWVPVSFTVPSTGTVGGPTRMRITMSSGPSPSPCGVYAEGETEDYTVNLTTVFSGQRKAISSTNLSSVESNHSIGIYPNPATDVLFVTGFTRDKEIPGIEIYDMAGKRILVNTLTGNSIKIGMIPNGAYVIKMKLKNSIIYSGHFIKK